MGEMMKPIIVPNRIDLIRLLPRGTIGAEIGVWRGWFSTEILGCPVKMLYLIDPWCRQPEGQYQDSINSENQDTNLAEARANLSGHRDRCVFIQGFSADVARQNTNIPPLDWVYIDGNHSYANVKEDLELWSKRLKADGVLMGHDYTEGRWAKEWHMAVVPAVNDFCRDQGWHISHLTDEELPSFRLERNNA